MTDKLFALLICGVTMLLTICFRFTTNEPNDPYDD